MGISAGGEVHSRRLQWHIQLRVASLSDLNVEFQNACCYVEALLASCSLIRLLGKPDI